MQHGNLLCTLRRCDLYGQFESNMRTACMEYLFHNHMWVLTLSSVSQLSSDLTTLKFMRFYSKLQLHEENGSNSTCFTYQK